MTIGGCIDVPSFKMPDLGVIFYFDTMTNVPKYFPQRASSRWENIHFDIHFTFVNFSCFFLRKNILYR